MIPVWEQLATDQFDPWQIFPRWVFAPSSSLLVSAAFVVVSRVGCLGVPGVMGAVPKGDNFCDFLLLPVMKNLSKWPLLLRERVFFSRRSEPFPYGVGPYCKG